MSRLSWWLSSSMLVLSLVSVSTARADIRNPQDHPEVELQPHLVLQWHHPSPGWGWNDDGVGLGLHAGIPVISRGPVPSINNSLAIGVGLDWAYFNDVCGNYADCSANDFWVPIYVEWNFFFSDLISAFPDFGLAIEHSRWSTGLCNGPGPGRNLYVCSDGSHTDVELVLWLGVRFHLSKAFALTLKLGTPSLLLGASFFL